MVVLVFGDQVKRTSPRSKTSVVNSVEEIIAEKLVIYHVKSVDDELIYKGRICCRECA